MTGTARSVRRVLVTLVLLAAAGTASLTAVSSGAVSAAPASAVTETDACGYVRYKPSGVPWACTFVDNFAGSTLDVAKWIAQQTELTGFRTGRTCYVASPANIAVGDGVLRLSALENGWFVCKNPLRDFRTRYTGGMVGTRGNFSQAFGRFEVRAKYPIARTSGLHGGFWMYPRTHLYGTWPASGEIDVAEWWSNDPTLVLPSLHFLGRDPLEHSGWGCRVGDVSAFHTYAVEWYRSFMRFLIDGQECWRTSWTPTAPLVAPQPFDHPFSLILNMGVGTSSGANKITSRTPFPSRYVVDYVKAWR